MRPKTKPQVTQEQVSQALKRFKAQGGTIHKLPDQRTPARKAFGDSIEQFLSMFVTDLADAA